MKGAKIFWGVATVFGVALTGFTSFLLVTLRDSPSLITLIIAIIFLLISLGMLITGDFK